LVIAMKINLLLIIDSSATGAEPAAGQSFGDQLMRRLRQQSHAVTADYVMADCMNVVANRLQALPLARYDLIVVQTGHRELMAPAHHTLRHRLSYAICRPSSLAMVARKLTTVLVPLRRHRHRVVLLTPFPNPQVATGWLRRQGRQLFLAQGEQAGVGVFDTHTLIGTTDEYFQPGPNDLPTGSLSAISHELLGNHLLDFYRAQPTNHTTDWVNRWIDSGRAPD
jgi:hypothetical protein